MKSKTKIIVTAMLITVITIFILWCRGVFYIVDRQTSPNGKITTTVYSKNVSDTFPKNDGFTIKSSGDFKGIRIYTDGSEYENMWCSPDSKHRVIATVLGNHRLLELVRYEKNSVVNLNLYINMNMSSHNEFTALMTDKADWETLQFNFVQWKEELGSMTVDFDFTDYIGRRKSGKLDFNCETGVISNIEFNQPS